MVLEDGERGRLMRGKMEIFCEKNYELY